MIHDSKAAVVHLKLALGACLASAFWICSNVIQTNPFMIYHGISAYTLYKYK